MSLLVPDLEVRLVQDPDVSPVPSQSGRDRFVSLPGRSNLRQSRQPFLIEVILDEFFRPVGATRETKFAHETAVEPWALSS